MLTFWTIGLCWIGALSVLLIGSSRPRLIRSVALGVITAGAMMVTWRFVAYCHFPGATEEWLHLPWIPSLGMTLALGADGISYALILLTALVAFCAVLMSWRIELRVAEYHAHLLFLIGAVYGVFQSLDLFVLFVFYELAILPKYFLIAIWGGERRTAAAMQLVLYSFLGGALVLLGMVGLHVLGPQQTLSLERLMRLPLLAPEIQRGLFFCFFIGFGILAGLFPFHSWAPVGHVAAPAPISMLLAGVVMKLGAYGCLRVAVALFPEGARFWAPWMAGLATAGILYAALVAYAQKDFKAVIGFSSVSHMGFVLLGFMTLNETGWLGAVLQMISHGILGSLLFALVGEIWYRRIHTRKLNEMDGGYEKLPGVGLVLILAMTAAMGIPGFSGFIAELHVLIGIWRVDFLTSGILLTVVLGMVATFAYSGRALHAALFQRAPESASKAEALPMTLQERFAVGLLLTASLLIGIFPNGISDPVAASLKPIWLRFCL